MHKRAHCAFCAGGPCPAARAHTRTRPYRRVRCALPGQQQLPCHGKREATRFVRRSWPLQAAPPFLLPHQKWIAATCMCGPQRRAQSMRGEAPMQKERCGTYRKPAPRGRRGRYTVPGLARLAGAAAARRGRSRPCAPAARWRSCRLWRLPAPRPVPLSRPAPLASCPASAIRPAGTSPAWGEAPASPVSSRISCRFMVRKVFSAR